MLNGMTAFLEAIDQRTEALAGQTGAADADDHDYFSDHVERVAASDQAADVQGLTLLAPRRASPPLQGSLNASAKQPTSTWCFTSSDLSLDMLKLQCTGLQNKLDHQQEQIELLQSECATAQEQHGLSEKRCVTLEDQLSKCQREASYFKESASSAQEKLARADSEIRMLHESKQDLIREISEYRASSRSVLEGKEKELEDYRRRIALGEGSRLGEISSSVASSSQLQAMQERQDALQEQVRRAESERERWQKDTVALQREVSRLQEQTRLFEEEKECLQMEVREAKETLEGEMAAHEETKELLRSLQSEVGHPHYPYVSSGGAGDVEGACEVTAISSAQFAQCQEQLDGATHRVQMLSYQLMEKQAALDALSRSVSEWKTRYDTIARRVEEEEAATAAGFGVTVSSGFPSHPGLIGSRHAAGFSESISIRGGGGSDKHALHSDGIVELRLHSAAQRLLRSGGTGRRAVGVLQRVDDVVVRVARFLRRHPLLRVVLVGYMAFVQLWVVIMFIVNLRAPL